MSNPCEVCKHNKENEDAWCLDCEGFFNFAPVASMEEVEALRRFYSNPRCECALEDECESCKAREAVEEARRN